MVIKNRKIIACIFNGFIVIGTIFIMVMYLTKNVTGPLGETTRGVNALRAFTNLSNIFCAIVALLMIIFPQCPNWLRRLQFMSTTAVVLTFAVVVLFLNPLFIIKTGELFSLFSGSMFFTHFTNPLLAVIVFVFMTQSKYTFTRRDIWLNLLPILGYGLVYFLNVLVFQTWPDFYNFTFGGQLIFVPIVVLAIFGLTLGLSWILSIIARKRN